MCKRKTCIISNKEPLTPNSQMHKIASNGLCAHLTLIHARVFDTSFSNFEHPFLRVITMNRLIKDKEKKFQVRKVIDGR